eukprot:TRINITY_DN67858_c10_g2_i1.p1 TRINITY_DN67858_c10_g2~~TRINITY_DN67858_c10_g2_i1.p1  ORF type:complete len:112 (+),score=0.57 TRINITY_DN67858_c10_g2_i1:87-422(+)
MDKPVAAILRTGMKIDRWFTHDRSDHFNVYLTCGRVVMISLETGAVVYLGTYNTTKDVEQRLENWDCARYASDWKMSSVGATTKDAMEENADGVPVEYLSWDAFTSMYCTA